MISQALECAERAGARVGRIAVVGSWGNLPTELPVLTLNGPAESWIERLRRAVSDGAEQVNALLADDDGAIRALIAADVDGTVLDVLDLIVIAGETTLPPLGAALFDRGFVPLRDMAGGARVHVRSDRIVDTAVVGGSGPASVSMTSLGRNGRFGNQILQYAFLRLYGLRAGVEIATPLWDGEELFGFKDLRPAQQHPELRFGAFDDDDLALWDMDAPPVNVDFWGYFQEIPATWQRHRSFLRHVFRFRADWNESVNAAVAGRTLVSIHVRRGDYRRFSKHEMPWYRIVPTAWYREWLDEVWPTLSNPILHIATDEPDAILPEFEQYPRLDLSALLITTGMPADILDFALLTRADLLAVVNSSFSRCAALLATPEQRTVLPSFEEERLRPYKAWDDRAFWQRFATPEACRDTYGSEPASRLRRSLMLRQIIGQHQATLAWREQQVAYLESQLDCAKVRVAEELANLETMRGQRDDALRERDQTRAERDKARAECDRTRAECDRTRAERDKARTERDKARTERDATLTSTSWRITAPLRLIAHFVRRLSYKARMAMALAMKRNLAASRAGGRANLNHEDVSVPSNIDAGAIPPHNAIIDYEEQGLFHTGSYGSDLIPLEHRYLRQPEPHISLVEQALRKYELDTAKIDRIHFDGTPPVQPWVPEKFLPFAAIDQKLAARQLGAVPDSSDKPSFSLVTSFCGSIDHFARTARSVAAIYAAGDAGTIEWIISNNNGDIPSSSLLSHIPASLHPGVRIIGGQNRLLITESLNAAIQYASNDWIVFLDYDSLLRPKALDVLRHYIMMYRKCRYISSGVIDIDDDDNILRYRRHHGRASEISSMGLDVGHLKAIRRDVFDEIGPLDPCHDLAWDYELALRLAEREPLLRISDYLSTYRWSGKPQSVAGRRQRDQSFHNILRLHIQRLLPKCGADDTLAAAPSSGAIRRSPIRRGATIIRTQGRRLDLFGEALASVEAQSFPLTPIVVVHGDTETHALVTQWCVSLGSSAVVLPAGDVKRLRGYPCNIGLDYVKAHADQFDFVGFLDDDDIHYPDYAARMVDALEFSGADIVYAEANRREPWKEHVSGPALMPSVCLVSCNFIVINGFSLRVDSLVNSGISFEEDMEYLEDWNFLISLLGAGLRFFPLFETVTEFRIFGDGNTTEKRYPELYTLCEKRCLDNGARVARALGPFYFYNELMSFEFSSRRSLTPSEERQLIESQSIYEKAGMSKASE